MRRLWKPKLLTSRASAGVHSLSRSRCIGTADYTEAVPLLSSFTDLCPSLRLFNSLIENMERDSISEKRAIGFETNDF